MKYKFNHYCLFEIDANKWGFFCWVAILNISNLKFLLRNLLLAYQTIEKKDNKLYYYTYLHTLWK